MFSFKRIEKSDEDVNFDTGLQNAKVFLWVVKRLKTMQALFTRICLYLLFLLKNFITWPDSGAVRRTLPKCFEKKFCDFICIIDCSKVFFGGQRTKLPVHRPGQIIHITTQSNVWWGYTNWSGQFSFIWMGWMCIRQADNLAVWIS